MPRWTASPASLFPSVYSSARQLNIPLGGRLSVHALMLPAMLCLLTLFSSMTAWASGPRVRIYGQTLTYGGPNGPYTSIGVSMVSPSQVIVDPATGTYYLTDKANPGQLVSYSPSQGGNVLIPSSTLINASALKNPTDLAFDASDGTIFVADSGNGRIVGYRNGLAYEALPAATMVAGANVGVMSSLAVDASHNLYVVDQVNNRILKIPYANGALAIVSATALATPATPTLVAAVTTDPSGNVFYTVRQSGNQWSIEKESADGTTYTPVVSEATGYIGSFDTVAVNAAGDIFISDLSTYTVMKFPAGETYTGLTATNSYWMQPFSDQADVASSGPQGVGLDASGNPIMLLKAGQGPYMTVETTDGSSFDLGNPGTGTENTLAIEMTFTSSGSIGAPLVLTQGAAGLDFTDTGWGSCTTNGTSYVYAVGETCTVIVNFTPMVPGVRMGSLQIKTSNGGAVATAYLHGIGFGGVATFPPGTTSTLTTAGTTGIALDANRNLFTVDATKVQESVFDGTSYATPVTLAEIAGATGVVVDGSGNLIVSVNGSSTLTRLPYNNGTYGAPVSFSGGFSSPQGLTIDGSGNIFVADYPHRVAEVPYSNGTYGASVTVAAIPTFSVAVDSSGNVFSGYVNNVQEIPYANNSYGQPVTLSDAFKEPSGLAVDAAGNLFIIDFGTNVLEELVNTDNGYGAPVMLQAGSRFRAIALDAMGNIYFSDSGLSVIKKVDLAHPAPLSFATTAVGSTSSDSPKTVTLANNGTGGVCFAAPSTGNNPSISAGFSYSTSGSDACPQLDSLAAGSICVQPKSSCSIPISFQPTTSGNISGSLVILDNNLVDSGSATQTVALSGEAIQAVDHLVLTAGPPSTSVAGASFNVTVTAYSSTDNSTVAADYSGPLAFVSSDSNAVFPTGAALAMTGGVGTFSITLKTAGQQTLVAEDASGSPSVTSSNILVTAAMASAVSAASGSGQSAMIGAQFTSPLTVEVTDKYGNPVGGNLVTFTAPATGAGATLSAPSCTTSSTPGTTLGTCSVKATANGTANTTAYTVSASASGVDGRATFALTNLSVTPTLTISSTPATGATPTYGQSVTLTSTATPSSAGGSSPSGAVTFKDGSAVLTSSATPVNGVSTYTLAAPAVGNHSYSASSAADTNFNAAASTNQDTITVVKASSTLGGPATQPVLVVSQQAGTVPVTIAGQYSGAEITPPSGSIGYTIKSATNATVASGSLTIVSGAVSIPVASTLAPGSYTVSASYAGDENYNAATQLTVNLQVGQIQPVIAWTQPAPITYGTTLATVLNAVAQDQSGSAPVAVPGTFVYAVSGSVVTSSTVLAASPTVYTISATFTPTDATTYKSATGSVRLTVNQASPSVALMTSTNQLLVQNPVTLMATVSSSSGTPSGSVTFLDGTALLGTAPLANGVAALTTSSLAVGSHSITAVYGGDTNFVTASSSPVVTVEVDDFNLTISATSISGSSVSQTVVPGGQAIYNFTISPTGSATFAAAVNLSVTGLPAGATYTISPSLIASGSGATNVTLSIKVPGQTVAMQTGEKLAPLAFAFLLLPFSERMRRKGRKISRLVVLLLLIAGGTVGIATLTGCGSTTGFFASPQQTYNVTITGVSGALTHSTTVTLTVE